MKRKGRYIIIFIILFSTLLVFFLLYKTINELKYRKGRPEQILYTSNINSDISYKVYLKNNPFIDDKFIVSDLSYISSLIDNIDLSYTFEYNNDKILNLDYQYWIEARVISEYIGDSDQNLKNPIWNKSYNLTDVLTNNTNNGNINIQVGNNINFEYYSNMIKEFSNSLSIGTNSRLEVSLIVKIGADINKEYNTVLQIPLGVKAFDMTIYKDYQDNEVVYNSNQTEEKSYVMAIIYIFLMILIIYPNYYLIKKIINRKKNKCLMKVKKILKDYDDRIIIVNNFVNYKKLDVINVSSFEELINLSDETFEPIIYWEKSSSRNFEGWFAIIKNRIVYLYILNCSKNDCNKCQ